MIALGLTLLLAVASTTLSAGSNNAPYSIRQVTFVGSEGHAGSDPALVIGKDGALHLFWAETTEGFERIWYRRSVNDSWGSRQDISWNIALSQSTENITRGNADVATPAAAIDSAGTVHAVWVQTFEHRLDHHYATVAGGVVSDPIEPQMFVAEGADYLNKDDRNPCVATRSFGLVAVAWERGDPPYVALTTRKTSGDFSPPLQILTQGRTAAMPSMVVDPNDVIYVVWIERNLEDTSWDVMLYDAQAGTRALSSSSVIRSAPGMVLSPDGGVLTAWFETIPDLRMVHSMTPQPGRDLSLSSVGVSGAGDLSVGMFGDNQLDAVFRDDSTARLPNVQTGWDAWSGWLHASPLDAIEAVDLEVRAIGKVSGATSDGGRLLPFVARLQGERPTVWIASREDRALAAALLTSVEGSYVNDRVAIKWDFAPDMVHDKHAISVARRQEGTREWGEPRGGTPTTSGSVTWYDEPPQSGIWNYRLQLRLDGAVSDIRTVRVSVPTDPNVAAVSSNPFNSSLKIEHSGWAAWVSVYDVRGRRIASQNTGSASGGTTTVWSCNGKDMSGRSVASGVYFVRFVSVDSFGDQTVITRRVALAR